VRVLCLRIASRTYFWRVQGRHEVDFVIESGAEVIAAEVKATTRFDSGDLAGLKAFLAVEPRCKAAFPGDLTLGGSWASRI